MRTIVVSSVEVPVARREERWATRARRFVLRTQCAATPACARRSGSHTEELLALLLRDFQERVVCGAHARLAGEVEVGSEHLLDGLVVLPQVPQAIRAWPRRGARAPRRASRGQSAHRGYARYATGVHVPVRSLSLECSRGRAARGRSARTDDEDERLEGVGGLLQVEQRDLGPPRQPARLQVRVAERARDREPRLRGGRLGRGRDDERGSLPAHGLVAWRARAGRVRDGWADRWISRSDGRTDGQRQRRQPRARSRQARALRIVLGSDRTARTAAVRAPTPPMSACSAASIESMCESPSVSKTCTSSAVGQS